MKDLILVLHNIRSTYNVGAILRTADGAGVHKVYLCGYTPTPVDRFGRKRGDMAKASLGAEESVEWGHVDDVKELIHSLKEKGVCVVALEQDKSSIPYTSLVTDKTTALVLGPEVEGIEKEVLSLCDEIVEIPMYGKKESLNVSVAAGVMLYQLTQ